MSKRTPLLLFTFILLVNCSSGPEKPIDELFEEYYQDQLKFNPIESTSAGDTDYNDVLPNFISDEYISDQLASFNKYEDAFSQYNAADLTETQALARDVLLWEVQNRKAGLEADLTLIKSPLFGLPAFKLMPINQIFSLHLFMGQLGSGGGAQPFKTVEDYDNWLSRMDDYFEFIATTKANMQEGIDKGVVHPKVIVEKMIAQLDPFIKTEPENHLFFGPIRNIPEGFSEDDKIRLTASYTRMVDILINQYSQLQSFLTDTYVPSARETAGIVHLPGGKETYDVLIRQHTSTTMTADEIHELGLSEVARIESEMIKIKDQIGFRGDLKAFFNHVRTSKEQMPFTEPEQVIANFEAMHETMKPQIEKLFDMTPKAQFVVRRTEAFREASASAEYNSGSKDGSRPGIFYVPIPNVRSYNKYSDESLFLHEAIPGHHYQLSLQQENEELPSFMHTEGLGVFVEGWALYSESLGKELGLYTDPYQEFGMLGAEMHRAVRLVVDTGMHSKGWTREQAIQFSKDHEAESEASIISEIERYMIAPGQALSYKIGQLKILELRSRAEETLGDDFNIKEFHNQVIGSGSLPLEVLERKIDRWIEAEKS